jgi:ElaA protein
MTPASTDAAGPGRVRVEVATFAQLSPHTAYALWQLRESVFVVEQTCPYLELDGRDTEPGTRHVWLTSGTAEGDAPPLGYLRLLDDGAHARIGRVLVAPDHRGRGFADRLVERALQLAGARPVRLDAQTYLQRWYARWGFTATGPEFLEDGIPHVPMARPAPADRPAPPAQEAGGA